MPSTATLPSPTMPPIGTHHQKVADSLSGLA
jgi:hypothetical protein